MTHRRETEWSAWMAAALHGDEVAYRRFLEAVTPHLRMLARRRLAAFGVGIHDHEDVVQEALLAIHLKRGTWDVRRPIGPWISVILRNKLIDALRRRGHLVNVPIDDVIDTIADEQSDTSTDLQDIGRMMAHLRPVQRDIVKSVSLDGYSVRDTAMRLSMTENAVRVALHRALRSLAAIYRGGE
ncbi:sigma-70 family RNA polymerase sigma factor [Aurantimonas endophytica]|uniref:RNA polymerase sigma-70 factor (ECF subfamily) n=1 Tax=Aurantimonas endophytica TaxID=1522175 RepID=A0A7W6HI57_9HYPH|nr:sigma-70 family RNA polymerase sigma factor [Aurantimonas endophytica]MBB4005618.1 RNA polymerase sigma-70 factor (ECF subfamily) [Aurantimonas endophytica]MCO6406423.1 sigma-70 family RNA polymerase sigma factor [Aurantimonas endophytica]